MHLVFRAVSTTSDTAVNLAPESDTPVGRFPIDLRSFFRLDLVTGKATLPTAGRLPFKEQAVSNSQEHRAEENAYEAEG